MTRETEAQRPGRFFYGWVIVGAMAMARIIGMSMGNLNFGLFIQPMGSELGIERATFGWAQTARLLVGAAASPLVGRLIDRFGSRGLLAGGALVIGVAMAGVAHISHPWQLVALFAVMGIVTTNGPGALATTVPVVKWFVRKRGRAMGWLFLANSLGGTPVVPLTQGLIGVLGWRNAWIVLAGIGVGVIVPMSLLLVRRQPEDMGLAPDGDQPTGAASGSTQGGGHMASVPQHAEETSWMTQEAIRSSTFWRLVFVFSIAMLASSSTHLHVIPHFMDRGFDAQIVAYGRSMEVGVAGFSMFAMGFLVQRIPARLLGGMSFVLLGVAIFLFIIGDTPLLLFLAMGISGFGVGGMLIIQDYLWADYFGRRHQGSIRGFVSPVILFFGAIGPPLAGYVRDATGSYSSIWWVAIGLLLVAAVVLVLAAPPRKRLTASLASL